MKRFFAAFILLLCLSSGQAWAENKEIPAPIINGFRINQHGETLRISFNFRNLAGGISEALVAVYSVIIFKGNIQLSATMSKKIDPAALIEVVNFSPDDISSGSAIIEIGPDDIALKDKMLIKIGMIFKDTLGRETEMVKDEIVYKKQIKA